MIEVKVDSRPVLDALNELARRAGDLKPALKEIGEELVESTKQRFSTSTGPDGEKWEANSPVTLDRYLNRTKGNFKKDGSLSKRGEARSGGKKPLVDSGTLMDQIHYRVTGNVLEVGSNQEYAAMQQFGGTKGQFPHLWGDIPARPFLGLSGGDEQEVLKIIQKHLRKAVE